MHSLKSESTYAAKTCWNAGLDEVSVLKMAIFPFQVEMKKAQRDNGWRAYIILFNWVVDRICDALTNYSHT